MARFYYFLMFIPYSEGKKEISPKEEAHILIHALRDANLPKFLAEDVPLFESIMADLFPGMKPPEPDYGALEVVITHAVYFNCDFKCK